MRTQDRIVRKVHKQRARKLERRGESVRFVGPHWVWYVPESGMRNPRIESSA